MPTMLKRKPKDKQPKNPMPGKIQKGSIEAWLNGFGTWAGDPGELTRLQKEVDEMREASVIDFSEFDSVDAGPSEHK